MLGFGCVRVRKMSPQTTRLLRQRLPLICVGLWLFAVVNLIGQWRLPSADATAVLPAESRAVVKEPNRRADPEDYPAEPMWLIDSPFDGLITSVAREQGLDPSLIKAVVQAESAFDPYALSQDGAQGLMQLLPETAARLGIVDLLNPYLNLVAGTRHLKYLLARFDGDLVLALAAYNAGEYAVRRNGGVPPYPETRVYLYRVLGLHSHYAVKQPASGGTPGPASGLAQTGENQAEKTIIAAVLE